MRLLAVAAILCMMCEAVSTVMASPETKLPKMAMADAPPQMSSTGKRFLKGPTVNDLEDEGDEERKIVQPDILKRIAGNLDNMQKLSNGQKIGGWLDKTTLDKLLHGKPSYRKIVFGEWKAAGRSSEKVTNLIKNSDPAIAKIYERVYKMYALFMKA